MIDDDIDLIFDESVSALSGSALIRRHSPIIFMYPSLMVAFLLGFFSVLGERSPEQPGYLGILFLTFTFVNLSVLSIRYTRAAAWGLLGLGLALWLLCVTVFDQGALAILHGSLSPVFMSPGFYGVWISCLGGLIFADYWQSKMETWRIVGTELVCYRAIGIDERHPVSGIRIHVETDDVAKYALLGSGDLYFLNQSGRPLVSLKHVVRIRSKEIRLQQDLARAQELWSSMQQGIHGRIERENSA